MNKQRLHFPFLLLMYLTLPLTATAQVVSIPDPNLRAAIEEALGKASGATITTADMAKLTKLEAANSNISDLTGLEFATNLKSLWLGYGGGGDQPRDQRPLTPCGFDPTDIAASSRQKHLGYIGSGGLD